MLITYYTSIFRGYRSQAVPFKRQRNIEVGLLRRFHGREFRIEKGEINYLLNFYGPKWIFAFLAHSFISHFDFKTQM